MSLNFLVDTPAINILTMTASSTLTWFPPIICNYLLWLKTHNERGGGWLDWIRHLWSLTITRVIDPTQNRRLHIEALEKMNCHLKSFKAGAGRCVRECLFKCELWVNAALHTSQANGFSPVWILKCFFKWDLRENADSQTSQENGFSPVCVRMCLLQLEWTENDDLQTSQENGFSPVCILKWFSKWELLENADLQTSQENGFSPVWVRMWLFR